MLCFVTDQNGNELDILTGLERSDLVISSIEGVVIAKILPPKTGWNHECLVGIAQAYERQVEGGADAYLDNVWVGAPRFSPVSLRMKSNWLAPTNR